MKKILFVFGTRPEAIKLAPLIKEFQKSNSFHMEICVTGQHKEMLHQILDFFEINPTYNLSLMTSNQKLPNLTALILQRLTEIFQHHRPNLVITVGDTTTTLSAALAAYYEKIPVAHVEAGLRTYDKYSPFPEEICRVLVSRIADFHFAPTKNAENNLRSEGIKKNVFTVGNTVIDALHLGLGMIKSNGDQKYFRCFPTVDFSKQIILVTGHRRENFGKPIKNIAYALKQIASHQNKVEIIYPVHLNPNIKIPIFRLLKNQKNIHLMKPLDYPHFIWIMNRAKLVLTDSGGIQEEAPSLGKPVLVMRDVTERPEGIEAGTARLVGTDPTKIVSETSRLLNDELAYKQMAKAINPYGDGKTSKRIVKILTKNFKSNN